jgi:hypothetical protein
MSIADLFISASVIVGEFSTGDLCIATEISATYFRQVSFLWTSFVSHFLYRLVCYDEQLPFSSHSIRLHLIAWVIPLFTTIPLALNTPELDNPNLPCWLAQSDEMIYVGFFSLSLLSLLFNTFILLFIWRQLKHRARESDFTLIQSSNPKFSLAAKRLTLYVQGFVLLHVWCVLFFLQRAVWDNRSKSIAYWGNVISVCFQGVFNSVIFGSTKRVRVSYLRKFWSHPSPHNSACQ